MGRKIRRKSVKCQRQVFATRVESVTMTMRNQPWQCPSIAGRNSGVGRRNPWTRANSRLVAICKFEPRRTPRLCCLVLQLGMQNYVLISFHQNKMRVLAHRRWPRTRSLVTCSMGIGTGDVIRWWRYCRLASCSHEPRKLNVLARNVLTAIKARCVEASGTEPRRKSSATALRRKSFREAFGIHSTGG